MTAEQREVAYILAGYGALYVAGALAAGLLVLGAYARWRGHK